MKIVLLFCTSADFPPVSRRR